MSYLAALIPIPESDDIVPHLLRRIHIIQGEVERELQRTDATPDGDYIVGLGLVRQQFERTVHDIRLLRGEVERLAAALQLAYKANATMRELFEEELTRIHLHPSIREQDDSDQDDVRPV